jgi:DNA-binding winged helix-turn-helix (wHTH) protein
MEAEAEVLAVGELEVRPAEHCAWELYETVWGGSLRPDDRSVDVYVHKLRVKLGEALPEWQYIHTHFGFGYRLEPTLSRSFHTTATRP